VSESAVTVADRLRIVPEFQPEEYDQVRELLFGKLERRLARWDVEDVELELSMKDRDTNSQRTTLECWLPGPGKLVATSNETDRDRAVIEVRDDLWRQIDRFVTKKEDARKR
jgi:ribosome-associated translation inhibitor RaiA